MRNANLTIISFLVTQLALGVYWGVHPEQVCSRAKFGTFWKPFSTNIGIFWHANFGIDPKLAETAPLFCRVTDDPFLPIMAHFRLIQNWHKQHPCSIG